MHMYGRLLSDNYMCQYVPIKLVGCVYTVHKPHAFECLKCVYVSMCIVR